MLARGWLAVGATIAFLLSGCVADPSGPSDPETARKKGAAAGGPVDGVARIAYWLTNKEGAPTAPLPELQDPIEVVQRMLGKRGAEPNVGIT